MFKKNPIAIVGLGGVFPGASTIDDFWRNILNRVDMAREAPSGRWIAPVEEIYDPTPTPDKAYSLKACFIENFTLAFHGLDVDEDLVRNLDPLYHLTLHAGRDAFLDSKTRDLDKSRIGVILSAIALPTDGSSKLTRKILGKDFESKLLGKKYAPRISLNECLASRVTSFPASLLASSLGLGGGAFTLDAACASSLYSVKLACDELQAFRADAMLAGGVSRPEQLYTQVGFSQLRALSPSGKCSPFDKNADGLVVGEGAGVVVLKRLEDALRDGDRIYSVIRGAGLSNDMSANLLAPDNEGQVRAMQLAYQSAGWSPSDVDIIECHGAGTPVGDAAELTSLEILWKDMDGTKPGQCAIGSVKSNIGHLLTAAGAAGLIKTVLGLHHRVLPPSANFNAPFADSPLIGGPFRVQTNARTWTKRPENSPRRAAVSAFGFGGINAHLLLEEANEFSPNDQKRTGDFEAGRIMRYKHVREIKKSEKNRIAVVGMSARTGGAEGLREFQELVFNGKPPFKSRPENRWKGADEIAKSLIGTDLKGAFLEKLEVRAGEFRIPPNEIADILPQQLLMLKTAAESLIDAGLALRKKRSRMGAVIGISFDYEASNFHLRWNISREMKRLQARAGLNANMEDTKARLAKSQDSLGPPLTASRTLGALGGIVASRLAKEFGFGGPCFVVSQEEAAGLRALEIGARSLQRFETDAVLVGAVDLFCDVRSAVALQQYKNWTFQDDIFPFDKKSRGTLPGEGAIALILKRYEEALADGDRIYAVIRGMGSSSYSGQGCSDEQTYSVSLSRAVSDAGVNPESISYFEAFGTAQPDGDHLEADALNRFFKKRPPDKACALGAIAPNIGYAGAASGLAAIAKVCLCLYHEMIPPLRNFRNPASSAWADGAFHIPRFVQYWSTNRKDGPRRACAGILTCDRGAMHVVLESAETGTRIENRHGLIEKIKIEKKRPLGYKNIGLFCISGDDPAYLLEKLDNLKQYSLNKCKEDAPFEKYARGFFKRLGVNQKAKRAVSIIARNRQELEKGADFAADAIRNQIECRFNARNLVAYNPRPLGPSSPIAFVFPGSGNHFLGMGREIGVQWPEIFRSTNEKTEELKTQLIPHCFVPWRSSWGPDWRREASRYIASDVLQMIFGQVVHGGVMCDLVRSFGISPASIIGYSLGESAGHFAMGVWPDRGRMLHRMRETDLFSAKLAGPCESAREAWKIEESEPFEWSAAVVNRPAEEVKNIIQKFDRVRLLIVNTPEECVIGGAKETVEKTVAELGCDAFFLDGVVTVHCDAALPSADAYRALHLFPTSPIENLQFYSCANAAPMNLTTENAADSILKQALYGFDFPKTINRAYGEGVRVFIEMGPHSSCTRMIRTILRGRPHLAISASVKGEDEYLTVLKLLGALSAERIPLDLENLYGSYAYAPVMEGSDSTKSKTVISVPIGSPIPKPDPTLLAERPVGIQIASDNDIQKHPERSNFPEGTPNEPFYQIFSDVIKGLTKASEETAEMHRKFLDFSSETSNSFARTFELQNRIMKTLIENEEEHYFDDQPPAPSEGSDNRIKESSVNEKETVAAFDREMCMEFAVGSLAKVLGPQFSTVDSYPVRVRLPDEPLMLVDRILKVEGEKGSLGSGRVVTEHDVMPDAWYLDGDRAPVCISVEAGQADLFLCSFLGIDLRVKGKRAYRLLDAIVEFHRGLPHPGDTIRYDIEIEKFVRQGETYLFFFHFDGYIGGEHLITMTDGCAGFFTEEEIENSGGIIIKKDPIAPDREKTTSVYRPLVSFSERPEKYNEEKIDALRRGDLEYCFGPDFRGVKIADSLRLPGGRMKLIHRVLGLDFHGGRFGLGSIQAEADIRPDDWFLTCHFMDDMVMPGTLMYECCAHALRVLLQRWGWVTRKPGVCYEPVIGVRSVLKCRGPVTPKTRRVIYEIHPKEIGYSPEPYVIADALMYADNDPIVAFQDMSMKMTGVTKDEIEAYWNEAENHSLRKPIEPANPLYDRDKILAFAIGNPSEAFGSPYRVFDKQRVIARLPGPPYFFMDRIVKVEPEPWKLEPGGWIEAEYDLPKDAWYYSANRTLSVPFCVLLEIALQPCGWLAAYAGSALRSEKDLKFRNLGGEAALYSEVYPENGPLKMRSRMTKVSEAGEMIIENFDFEIFQNKRKLYEGKTYFGFFTKEALAKQVGIRDANRMIYLPSDREFSRGSGETLSPEAPIIPGDPSPDPPRGMTMPSKALLMIDGIETCILDGGPEGLGFIRGYKKVDPSEWFFRAHFYQDPVCPGSLGIESFLQLLKYIAIKRWGDRYKSYKFGILLNNPHQWTYRGQIIPKNEIVRVEAVVSHIQERPHPVIFANGFLSVDGLYIYKMDNFGIRLTP